MTRHPHRTPRPARIILAAALGAAVLGLTACAPDIPVDGPEPITYPVTSTPVDDVVPGPETDQSPRAELDGDRVRLTTFGSSSCPPIVTSVRDGGDRLTMRLAEQDGACTADFGPRTIEVVLPADLVDPAADWDELVLAAHDGTETRVPLGG